MEKNLKEIKSKTLAEGETTGHAHRVTVAVMERVDLVRLFEGPTQVIHEEHKIIDIPMGKWASDKVLERDALSEMVRRVVD